MWLHALELGIRVNSWPRTFFPRDNSGCSVLVLGPLVELVGAGGSGRALAMTIRSWGWRCFLSFLMSL